jgi:3-deoxy-D-manno-octulosonate 8-phosphate phosphatase (KDO 8-P phosphatase)
MNSKDGYALQLAVKEGYKVSIISGAKGDAIETRLRGLGITDIFLGIEDKLHVFEEISRRPSSEKSTMLYMGDDMPDYEAMKITAIAACPNDAAIDIKAISTYKAVAKGGEGCAREVIEKVLKLNDHWDIEDHIQSK